MKFCCVDISSELKDSLMKVRERHIRLRKFTKLANNQSPTEAGDND